LKIGGFEKEKKLKMLKKGIERRTQITGNKNEEEEALRL